MKMSEQEEMSAALDFIRDEALKLTETSDPDDLRSRLERLGSIARYKSLRPFPEIEGYEQG